MTITATLCTNLSIDLNINMTFTVNTNRLHDFNFREPTTRTQRAEKSDCFRKSSANLV